MVIKECLHYFKLDLIPTLKWALHFIVLCWGKRLELKPSLLDPGPIRIYIRSFKNWKNGRKGMEWSGHWLNWATLYWHYRYWEREGNIVYLLALLSESSPKVEWSFYFQPLSDKNFTVDLRYIIHESRSTQIMPQLRLTLPDQFKSVLAAIYCRSVNITYRLVDGKYMTFNWRPNYCSQYWP